LRIGQGLSTPEATNHSKIDCGKWANEFFSLSNHLWERSTRKYSIGKEWWWCLLNMNYNMAVGYKIYLHTNTDQSERHKYKMILIRKIWTRWGSDGSIIYIWHRKYGCTIFDSQMDDPKRIHTAVPKYKPYISTSICIIIIHWHTYTCMYVSTYRSIWKIRSHHI